MENTSQSEDWTRDKIKPIAQPIH